MTGNRQLSLDHTRLNGQISLRGYPQGSIIGPLLFNVFINDIFQALGRSSLYNYADDNTLSYAHHKTLIHTLQQDCSSRLHWFQENQMKVNPEKFQAINFGKRANCVITYFKCGMLQVKCEDSVVLLCIELDHNANILRAHHRYLKEICSASSGLEAPRPSSHSPRESRHF